MRPEPVWRRPGAVASAYQLPLIGQLAAPNSGDDAPAVLGQDTCPPGRLLEELRLLYQLTLDPLLALAWAHFVSLVQCWYDVAVISRCT